MERKLLWPLLTFLVLVFELNAGAKPPAGNLVKWFNTGERLFNQKNPTEQSDSLAQSCFRLVIAESERYPDHAHTDLLFQSYVRLGNLLDIRKDFAAAKTNYQKALDLQRSNPALSDSLIFKVYVYEATADYNLNIFDSANLLLLKAESLIPRFPRLPDKERLYNSLGALYFDNGNYTQSKNYFSKALQIVEGQPRADKDMIINFQANIAASLCKLGLFDQSLAIYKKFIGQRGVSQGILFNAGKLQATLGNYRVALTHFNKIDKRQIPGVDNEIAYMYIKLSKFDSAEYFLRKFESSVKKDRSNSIDIGINSFYRAMLLLHTNKGIEGLKTLQQAIIQFAGNFYDVEIFKNPSVFTGVFNPYYLYNALELKAVTLQSLFHSTADRKYLEASLDAFQSAMSLLRYIEKSYDTDDSKIFIKNKSQEIYRTSFSVALQLNVLYPDGNYLQQAFLIGEKNKASIISASLKERNNANLNPGSQKLLAEEQNIKYRLARLNISADREMDSVAVGSLSHRKMDLEIELSQIQRKLEQNSVYYATKFEDSYPDIKSLKRVLDRDEALLSFQICGEALHVFIITPGDFQYVCIDSFYALQRDINLWLTKLRTAGNGERFKGEMIGRRLYNRLIKPIEQKIPKIRKWVIIPDGILCYLPFESLPSGEGVTSLVETTEISYQLSARFLVRPVSTASGQFHNQVLSFAPFASQGTENGPVGSSSFHQLRYSYQEIKGLAGKQYLNDSATKEHFLQQINKYPIVHLATHAISDRTNPSASFISFYPSKQKTDSDRLFLEELYTLNMDATRLVIISACETGDGQLVNNEGVMSISRAFAYAGCASTINSLWKADDEATSYILSRFHIYLQKGYTKSKALQAAKIDYIHSDALYKNPDHWAHLILTGDNQPLYQKADYSNALLSFLILFSCLTIAAIQIQYYKSRKGSIRQAGSEILQPHKNWKVWQTHITRWRNL